MAFHRCGALARMQPDISRIPSSVMALTIWPPEQQPVEDQRAQRSFQPATHASFEVVAVGRVDEQMGVHIAPAVEQTHAKLPASPPPGCGDRPGSS